MSRTTARRALPGAASYEAECGRMGTLSGDHVEFHSPRSRGLDLCCQVVRTCSERSAGPIRSATDSDRVSGRSTIAHRSGRVPAALPGPFRPCRLGGPMPI